MLTFFIKGYVQSVADSDPGSGAFLTPGSRDGLKDRSRIRDDQPESYFPELKIIF